jgi:hypothetical protein
MRYPILRSGFPHYLTLFILGQGQQITRLDDAVPFQVSRDRMSLFSEGSVGARLRWRFLQDWLNEKLRLVLGSGPGGDRAQCDCG